MAQTTYTRKYRFGTVRKLRSGRYQATYQLDGARRYGENTWDNADDAGQWLDEVYDGIQNNHWRPSGGGLKTFKTWAEEWRVLPQGDGTPRKGSTLDDYENTFVNHVYPLLGNVAVETIDVATIKRFQEGLTKAFKSGCGNRKCVIQPCRARQKAEKYTSYVLDYCVLLQAMKANPYKGPQVFIPAVDLHRDAVWLSTDDIHALREQTHPHYRVAIMVAAYMGLRSGELWALRRSSVNPLRQELLVEASVREAPGQGLVMGPPKNGKSRLLSIPSPVLTMIEAHMEKVSGEPSDWLFPNQHARQNRHSTFRHRFFVPALERAKLPQRTIFHDLRHFCARYHISAGYELHDIKELMGHKSIAITSDVYGGLFDERRKEMAEKVGLAIDAHEAKVSASKVSEVSIISSRVSLNQKGK